MLIKKLLVSLMLVFLIMIASYFVYYSASNLTNQKIINGVRYQKVEEYKHFEPFDEVCQSLSPECGVCPGKIIDKECYVKIK